MEHKTPAELVWRRQAREMTLEGETVLSYVLDRPEQAGCPRMTAYYDRAVQMWKDRWERQLYPLACLELVHSRARSRIFRPWGCELTGKASMNTGELVSVVMTSREDGGWGRGRMTVWGCTWRLRDGTPLPLHMLVPPEYRGRKKLMRAFTEAGEDVRQSGGLVLDRDLEQKVPQNFCRDNVWLEEGELVTAFPQCALAPAGEGCPVLRVPLSAKAT